jgi:hypothetical protein
MEELTKQIATLTEAYERERGWWDWMPPPDCDASYFRLRRFVTLDAPVCMIESEIKLLRRKLALMQSQRLGVNVH